MSNKKYYKVHFPLYKVGDDVGHQWLRVTAESKDLPSDSDALYRSSDGRIEPEETPEVTAKAFLAYAEQLDAAAVQARALASAAIEHGLTLCDAGTHFVAIMVDENVGQKLLEEGLIEEDPFADDDEGYTDEEFGEDLDEIKDETEES